MADQIGDFIRQMQSQPKNLAQENFFRGGFVQPQPLPQPTKYESVLDRIVNRARSLKDQFSFDLAGKAFGGSLEDKIPVDSAPQVETLDLPMQEPMEDPFVAGLEPVEGPFDDVGSAQPGPQDIAGPGQILNGDRSVVFGREIAP